MALRIINPGLMTTVQDLGRYGYAHLGVTPAGAADALALRVANLLLGNQENTAALEMTLLGRGGRVRARRDGCAHGRAG